MLSFERLMHDHSAIFAAARTLGQAVTDQADATDLAIGVKRLDAVLAPHLALEDLEIYPLLLASRDAGQRIMAEETIAAYAHVADAWRSFAVRWDAKAIQADRAGFGAALTSFLDTLGGRVRTENEILYPMALRAAHIRLRAA